MIPTDAPPNSSMLSWHSCLAGRRNFYTKPLRNVDDGRTHGLLCAALIFVRRLQLVDYSPGRCRCPAMGLATIEQLALCSAKQIPGAQ